MSIFTQVEQTVSDYNVLWAAFRESAQQAADVTAAVAGRIAADRAATDERIATLTVQSRDPNRPEVVRQLAQKELERMQERAFVPTENETTAFDSAMQDAEAALRDFVATKRKLRDLFEQASGELKTMRANTLGDGSRDDELARRHIVGEQRTFGLLGETGRPGGHV